MTKAIDVILACKQSRIGRLTAYDIKDSGSVEFALGVKIDDEVDIWYVALAVTENGLYLGAPYWDAAAKVLYFPDIIIDAEAFKELCNATS
jgi:hypothetical protein